MDIIDEITGRLAQVPLKIATFYPGVWDGVVLMTINSLARMLLSLSYAEELDPDWKFVANDFSHFVGKIILDYHLPERTMGIFQDLVVNRRDRFVKDMVNVNNQVDNPLAFSQIVLQKSFGDPGIC